MTPLPTDDHSTRVYRQAFFFLLIAITIFRLFYISRLDLAPDEAYYWTWSRHLQWGYYDHPPLVAFLIFLTTAVAGSGEFGVRLAWVIIGAIITVILYRLTANIFRSERAGFLSAVLMNIILLASTGAVIVTPDGPQGLFWVLGVFGVYKAVEKENALWWYLAGMALGLGLLSKYTMVLFVPCIFLFLLSAPGSRRWLGRKEPYLALLLGIAIFIPVILWNVRHDWISFKFQLSHGLEVKRAAGWRSFGDYWAGQAGVVSPLMLLGLIWAMVKSAYEGYRRNDKNWLLLFWTSMPILIFFAYTSLRSKVEANWPALAYFSAVAAMAGLITESWSAWGKKKRAFAWAAAIMAFVFTSLAYLQPIYAVVPISAKRDPTSQVYGWRKLGDKIKEISATMDSGNQIFLLASGHQLVAESMFYTQGRIPVFQWDAPMRVNGMTPENAPPKGSQAIFFNEEQQDLPPWTAGLFDSCQPAGTLEVERNSAHVRTHRFWKCSGFKGIQGNFIAETAEKR